MVILCLCLLTAANDQLEYPNHRSCHSPRAQEAQPVSSENSQAGLHQDQMSDSESHLHTLMPMQPYSPLHIPQFPGPINMGFPPGIPLPLVTQATPGGSPSCGLTGNMSASKIRGASDCPGICPLCGATLRQARNLRRHLLSSCKYRFSSNSVQSSQNDSMMIEIKPEVDLTSYNEQSGAYGTDSGSSTCEQIICKPSPLPSPTSQGTAVVSPQSNIQSPTIARWTYRKGLKAKIRAEQNYYSILLWLKSYLVSVKWLVSLLARQTFNLRESNLFSLFSFDLLY